MTRLFISLYLGLLTTLFVFMVVAHLINTYLYVDIENIIRAENFSAEVELLNELDTHISIEKRQALIDMIAKRNQAIIQPVALHDIPEHIQQALTSKHAWFDDEHYDYFKAFTPSQYFSIEIDDNHPLLEVDDKVANAILLALVFFIALACFIWLFGLHRKLKHIESTLIAISDGDLNARVSVKKSRQVGRLNIILNNMAAQIQNLLTSHKKLTHIIAHEFRSPLFRMQMQLEMLIPDVNAKGSEKIQALEEDIFCLEDLVEELLSYAKMERAELKLNLETVDIAQYFQHLYEKLSIICTAKLSFESKLNGAKCIAIDKALLERCITNLVKNADKYGKSDIYLTVIQSENSLSICVEDNGSGIPIEQQTDIFKPFHQVNQSQRSLGFGLGLAIVKEIALLHHGEITVAESEHGGAKFMLIIGTQHL